MQENFILANNASLAIKEYKGQRVVTFKDIDMAHNRNEGIARRNFGNNRKHFKENIDYYKISSMSKFYTMKIPPRGLVVLTQTGYLMIIKSFTDDLSWQIQRQLVDNYFNVQPHPQEPSKTEITPPQPSLPVNMYDAIRLMVDKMQEHDDKMLAHDNEIASLKNEVKSLANKQTEIIIAEPEPSYYIEATNCSISKNIYTITEIAEAFGMSGRVLNRYLYTQGVIKPCGNGWDVNKKYCKETYVKLSHGSFVRNGEKAETTFTMWTYEGMAYLCEYLKSKGFTQNRGIRAFDKHAARKKTTKKSKKKNVKTSNYKQLDLNLNKGKE